MLYKYIYFFSIIPALLLFSCTESEPVPDYMTCGLLVSECDPATFNPDTSGIETIIETSCLISLGTRNMLEESRKYMWFYCDVVNSLEYEDSLGNHINLDITSKKHYYKNTVAYGIPHQDCPEFMYASNDEYMEVMLENEQINIKFNLKFKVGGISPNIYDGLSVNKTTFDDDRPYWSNEVLFMFLNNRNPQYTFVRYGFNSQLTIQGNSYENVYWNDGRYDIPMVIYYNKQCGLLAFRDDLGTLWKIIGYN